MLKQYVLGQHLILVISSWKVHWKQWKWKLLTNYQIFVSYLVHINICKWPCTKFYSWKQASFFHAFATSGNIAYFPVSLLISLSRIKGMFARSSVSYHVQLTQNREASREKTRRFDSECMNLGRIPSTANKPSLCLLHAHAYNW